MDEKATSEEDAKCCTVHAPIERLGSTGRWIRKTLLEWSLRGTPLLVAVQTRRTPGWTKFFQVASFLGEEDFYTIVVCFLLWIVDQKLAFLFTALLGMGFYSCNTLKNALRLPRPAVPPVKPVHVMHDWSFPSHHSVNAVAMPWYLYFYSLDAYSLSTQSQLAFFLITCLWSGIVLFDRIYLGVHTPADVVAGGLLGVLLLFVFRFCHLDTMLLDFLPTAQSSEFTQSANLYLLPVWVTLFVWIHPQGGYPTLTVSETICLIGIMGGYFGAIWHFPYPSVESIFDGFNHYPALCQLGIPDVPLPKLIGLALIRFTVGLVILLLIRFLLKVLLRPVSRAVYEALGLKCFSASVLCKTTITHYHSKRYRLPENYGKVDTSGVGNADASDLPDVLKNCPYPPNFTDTHYDSDIPMRMIVYVVVGWAGTTGVPYVLHHMGL